MYVRLRRFLVGLARQTRTTGLGMWEMCGGRSGHGGRRHSALRAKPVRRECGEWGGFSAEAESGGLARQTRTTGLGMWEMCGGRSGHGGRRHSALRAKPVRRECGEWGDLARRRKAGVWHAKPVRREWGCGRCAAGGVGMAGVDTPHCAPSRCDGSVESGGDLARRRKAGVWHAKPVRRDWGCGRCAAGGVGMAGVDTPHCAPSRCGGSVESGGGFSAEAESGGLARQTRTTGCVRGDF